MVCWCEKKIETAPRRKSFLSRLIFSRNWLVHFSAPFCWAHTNKCNFLKYAEEPTRRMPSTFRITHCVRWTVFMLHGKIIQLFFSTLPASLTLSLWSAQSVWVLCAFSVVESWFIWTRELRVDRRDFVRKINKLILESRTLVEWWRFFLSFRESLSELYICFTYNE